MKIHVINLDRAPDRFADFGRVNAHLTETIRFSAVDGQSLDLPAMVARGEMDPSLLRIYTIGAVGNVLSHLALWDHAIATNQTLTIAEDDAIFNRAFVPAAEAILAQLPPAWDWISWGWNFDSFLQMDFLPGTSPCTLIPDENRMRTGIGAFQDQVIAPRPFPLLQAFGVPCYTISPKGAAAFKSFCWPMRRMRLVLPRRHFLDNVGIDVMTSMAYPLTQSFVSFPPLVIATNELDKSTVQRTPKAR